MQHQFLVFSVNKLYNYSFVFAGIISSQRQMMTTFCITVRNEDIGVFTYLDNFFFWVIVQTPFGIPDISTLFLLLYYSVFACQLF